MDKIEKKWSDNMELRDRVNELVDENTEIIYDYKELEKRIYKLEDGCNGVIKRLKRMDKIIALLYPPYKKQYKSTKEYIDDTFQNEKEIIINDDK